MPEALLEAKTPEIEVATQSSNGLMSAEDKKKLDGISIDLLYTNPNPYTATSGFTVNVDLSEYKILLIDFINQTDGSKTSNGAWFPVGTDCMAYGSAYNSSTVLRRPFTTSNTGVVFGNASHGGFQYASNLLIPWHIYGVKF